MNRKMKHALAEFLREEDGPTSVEYAVMLALIAVVCIGAVGALTVAVDDSFTTSANTISSAVSN